MNEDMWARMDLGDRDCEFQKRGSIEADRKKDMSPVEFELNVVVGFQLRILILLLPTRLFRDYLFCTV